MQFRSVGSVAALFIDGLSAFHITNVKKTYKNKPKMPLTIPEELSKCLQETIEASRFCERVLYESWYKHDLPLELRWDPWSVANELRYAGQHICRALCSPTPSE